MGQQTFGKGLGSFVLGPGGQFVLDTANLGFSPAGKTLAGDDTNFGRQISRYLKDYTPGSSLWQTRLLFERHLFDELQELTDPKARRSWRRLESRYKSEHGSNYWWQRGEALPEILQ